MGGAVGIFPYQGGVIAFRRDDWMLQEIVHQRPYEDYVLKPLLEEVTPTSSFLDVGANVGTIAIPVARKAAKVTAVEMVPENARLIAINARLNSLGNITVLPCAVSDQLAALTFHQSRTGSNATVIDAELDLETPAEVGQILALPLDTISAMAQPDVIKIDIEGYEYRALHNACDVWARRPTWFLEFSDEHQRNTSGVEGGKLLQLFFDRGYAATILHRDMNRAYVGQNVAEIYLAWRDYMGSGITHLDLMMTPAPR